MDESLSIRRLESDLSRKPDDPALYYHLGLHHLGEESFALAIKFLARATSLDQKLHRANYYLGIAYACQGNINLALVEWEALLKLNPNYYRESRTEPPLVRIDEAALAARSLREINNRMKDGPEGRDVIYAMGLAYLCFGQLQMAGRHLEEAISLDAEYARAYLPLAEVYYLLGHPHRAVGLLEKFLRMRPQSFEGHLKLGELFILQKNVSQAVSHLRLAQQVKPDAPEIFCELGKAFRLQNTPDMAEKAFNKAISLNEDFGEAHFELGLMYEESYDFERAIKEYQRAAAANPGKGEIYTSLGSLYRRIGKTHESIECLEKALGFFPHDAETHYHIADAYGAIRKFPEAIGHYQEAARLNPKDVYIHYNMGIAYAQAGQYVDAIEAYTKALEINPEFVEPLYDIAISSLQAGKLREAQEYITSFLEKRPNNTFARFTLGSIYLRLGDLDAAIEEYTKAINSYPNHPYARFNLASGYARLGQYEKAEEEFRKALDANPPKAEDEIILFATLASSQSIIQSLGKAMTELKRAFQMYEEATSKFLTEESVKNRIKTLFGKFVPATVIQKVIEDDGTMEQEVRNVTVLFSDISGYSGMSETINPRETMTILNEYYANMSGIYRKYGGTLLYFQGDAQMIIFGAPIEHQNHSLQALRTAVEIRQQLASLEKKWAEEGRRTFDIGIGICQGEVVLGFINDGSRLQYTAIGDTVNTASRLQALSKQHDFAIMINEKAYQHVRDFVEAERHESVVLRGKSEPVTVYKIIRFIDEAIRREDERKRLLLIQSLPKPAVPPSLLSPQKDPPALPSLPNPQKDPSAPPSLLNPQKDPPALP